MSNKNFVINIGRQLGSGGFLIGKKLSTDLHVNFYDKELIQIASQESGLSKDVFERADEKNSFSIPGDFATHLIGTTIANWYPNSYLQNESLFLIQSDVIRNLAAKESCIFVGRCADYILRDHPRCINVFISANLDERIERIAQQQDISSDKAQEIIERTDKQRAGYYNYYSDKTWGAASSYHLCINSSTLGLDDTAKYIQRFTEHALKLK